MGDSWAFNTDQESSCHLPRVIVLCLYMIYSVTLTLHFPNQQPHNKHTINQLEKSSCAPSILVQPWCLPPPSVCRTLLTHNSLQFSSQPVPPQGHNDNEKSIPLRETNSKFAPEKWMDLEYARFPFGARPIFRGDNVSFTECIMIFIPTIIYKSGAFKRSSATLDVKKRTNPMKFGFTHWITTF